MVLIKGENPAAAAGTSGGSAPVDGQFRLFGYTLTEWNDIIDNIKQLMALKNGAAGITPHPESDNAARPQIAAPVIPAAPIASKADVALKQIEGALKVIVDNGGGDAKLVDILNQSNFTVKQLHDILSKALK